MILDVTDRSYHHGNLRSVLLDHAEETLRVQGVDALSLRELARRAGVSHSAPRKHFIDRRALLDALAERGFDRLTQMAHAVMDSDVEYRSMFCRYGACYVRFAAADAALLELMFASKVTDPAPAVQRAGERLFASFDDLIERGRRDGYFQNADVLRLRLLFIATMQGTAAMMASQRITVAQADILVADATTLILESQTAATPC